jgi:site-specific DNA recombinase
MKKLRCAIYTRKSSEEGLEQDFNSLDAQREACLAYITSQKGEGWTASPARYDDGGWSGGNMERPGLKQLLRDIEAGRVDIVVVYKVDRLTRSLSDFARIVETFDSREVSFVSVTQAFNTTSSMGRLTLNVLLSFAQFEREVTSERIRDKIAASKARGMWMGGAPPLGYTPHERTLLIDQREAPLVRSIFRRYLETGSVHVLARQLREEGVRSRCWTTAKGEPRGGAILSRGKLGHLLRNCIYVGEIRHRDRVYPGLHEAIVDRETFDAVQAMLDQKVRRRRSTTRESVPLTGLLFDAAGHRMSPVHSLGRSGRRYRYYNSAPLQSGFPADASSRRIPAEPIEELLLDRFRTWSGETSAGWDRFVPLVKRIEVHPGAVVVTFEPPANSRWREQIATRDEVIATADGMLRVTIASAVRTRGGRSSVMTGTTDRPRPDRTLIQALRSAHRILGEHGIDILSRAPDLDAARGIDDPWNRRIVRLACLAPDIQHAILTGRQPPGLTLADLVAEGVPLAWNMQREALGFASHG